MNVRWLLWILLSAALKVVARSPADGYTLYLGNASARRPRSRPSRKQACRFEFESWTGFLAPTGTPPEVISKINGEVVRITRLHETNERLPGFEWVGSSPAGARRVHQSQ